MKSVVASDSKVKLVYKDLPILGEASKIAAVAALASIKQGKHDAFHDALMTNTAKLDSDLIFKIAASVGIDVASSRRTWKTRRSRRPSTATWRSPRSSACAARRPS